MMNLGDAGTPCGYMDTRIARGNQIQISDLSDIFTVLPACSSGKVIGRFFAYRDWQNPRVYWIKIFDFSLKTA